MKILVTGGAGYIGSVVAAELAKENHDLVIVDNMQQGHHGAVPLGIEFIEADIRDAAGLDQAFRNRRIDAVMHLAAESTVLLSMTDPGKFFNTNIAGGINLLDAMRKHDVGKIIFSSSAAVYGRPQHTPMTEEHPVLPFNAYGETKIMFERILAWYGKAYGIKHISLRYFNAAGADGNLGENHWPETHLIPIILKAALANDSVKVKVFGTDYPTADGSCIRDYIHVNDIARAHLLALQKIDDLSGTAYNLGNGEGYSVKQVIESSRHVTGAKIPVEDHPRRPGDPAVLLAAANKAKRELGWNPHYNDIEEIIGSAWEWLSQHPEGYGD